MCRQLVVASLPAGADVPPCRAWADDARHTATVLFSAPATKAYRRFHISRGFSFLPSFANCGIWVHVSVAFICLHTNKIGSFLTRRSACAWVTAAVLASKINFVASILAFQCVHYMALFMSDKCLKVLLYTLFFVFSEHTGDLSLFTVNKARSSFTTTAP